AQMTALLALKEPIPMSQLAEALSCDRSNITGLIDRLEQQDLVTRREDPADRRVKMLVLTAKGRKRRAQIQEHVWGRLPNAVGLTDTQLAQLGAILNAKPEETIL
ncbi:MAG: MarR family transcriptional regulator, partial [Acidimicrobiia bacterium]